MSGASGARSTTQVRLRVGSECLVGSEAATAGSA